MMLSNRLLTVFFLLGLILVLILSLGHQQYHDIPYRSAIHEGPVWEEVNTMSAQGTDDYIRFVYALVKPSTGSPSGCCADIKELDKFAQEQLEENQNHHGEQTWYWKSIPVDKNEYVMLIWQDFRQNEYNWIAVKDTPTFWYTVRRNGRVNLVLDGQQLVCEWYTNKKYVEIIVNNPPNIKGWTAYDFWYSFAKYETIPTKTHTGLYLWLYDLLDNTCHNEAD